MTARCKFVCASKREYIKDGASVFEHEFTSATIVADGADDQSVVQRWAPVEALTVRTLGESPFRVSEQYYLDIAPTQEVIDITLARLGTPVIGAVNQSVAGG